MNSNRTRYFSTPTYGMQKRGLGKKPAPARQVVQTPDFTQAPDPLAGMPIQGQPGVIPPVPPVQQGFAQQPVYSTPQQMPPNSPQFQPPQTFAAPVFMQSGVPLPPMQSSFQQPNMPPIGNMASAQPASPAFSSRMQGFVPPAMQPAAPTVQPANPMQAPFAPMQQPMPPFGSMQTPPVYNYQAVQPPVASKPMQPVQSVATPAAPKTESRPLDADKLWTVFLFGLIPLLFIPCLFVSGIWSWVRYVFIGAAVIGLSGMWYRQMYTPTVRLITSMVYVALCIGSIAMLMQGASDIRQTSASNTTSAVTQQQVPSSDGSVLPSESMTPSPSITATPAPVSGPSEAERRLELFMNLWMNNDTTQMVQLVQPSWCSQQENPSMQLFMVLSNRTPEDFTIEEISGTDTDNSRTVTMRATINKNTGKAPSIYRFMVMMVREGDEWYVNPNSLATNDEQKQTATDENVVNTQDTGTVTEPPRTTVTPAPPASTTLYYNVGANFYHMDPNCDSVKAEYLPFDMSFSYSELKEVRKANNLSPCLKCDAPTNTLEEAGE